MYDVIVVGGGPVGSRVAIGLAVGGLSVLVLEKRASFDKHVCCTGLISAACVNEFHIPSLLTREEFNGVEVVSPSGQTLSTYREMPQAFNVKRKDFDAWYANEAILVGAEYLSNHHVTDISKKDDFVEVSCMNIDNVFQGKMVVLATGFGGDLMSQCGLKKSSGWTYGIQGIGHENTLDHLMMFIDRRFSANSFAWALPIDHERALCGLMTNKRPKDYFATFQKYLNESGFVKDIDDIQIRGITTKPTWNIVADRAVAVGDIAGQVKPLTGGGIYYGLLCADLAAETILNAFQQHSLDISTLLPYKYEAQQLLKKELRISGIAAKLFGMASNKTIDRFFKYAKKKGLLEKLASSNLPFDWHAETILSVFRRSFLEDLSFLHI